MKASEYIVHFLIKKQITDIFGYPGGMVTHLMDSLDKQKDLIASHVNYHEQASAFAACGYAQVSMKPGVAYATSGPGATNLITGICNAFFDNIPTIFLTGQVNTTESKTGLSVRQKGFQETDIISMVKDVTKYAAYVEKAEDLRYHLEKAYYYALEGRPGPVLLDIPMNIQRADLDFEVMNSFNPEIVDKVNYDIETIINLIQNAKRPCILVGAGIKCSDSVKQFRELAKLYQIPVVSSMLAIDVLTQDSPYNFGFIGAYGMRHANFIIAKSDLILSLGSRLDVRQIGSKKEAFAINAQLIRVDIDPNELTNKIKDNEIQIVADVKDVIADLINKAPKSLNHDASWLAICQEIKTKLEKIDIRYPNLLLNKISTFIEDDTVITTDVGQNQVWAAQSLLIKENQLVLFSGGHGAMGYSLPAAIGAYYASLKPVVCISGDGGLQMNIQELQFIAREKLPITIILMNNFALGMIRHFQELYFLDNYTQTIENRGYSVPNFKALSTAYGLQYHQVSDLLDIKKDLFSGNEPRLIELVLDRDTYVFPKLEFGKPNQDQEPLLDRDLYNYLMSL